MTQESLNRSPRIDSQKLLDLLDRVPIDELEDGTQFIHGDSQYMVMLVDGNLESAASVPASVCESTLRQGWWEPRLLQTLPPDARKRALFHEMTKTSLQ